MIPSLSKHNISGWSGILPLLLITVLLLIKTVKYYFTMFDGVRILLLSTYAYTIFFFTCCKILPVKNTIVSFGFASSNSYCCSFLQPHDSLHTFRGHSTCVMSVDFHSNRDDLICSCDGNGEIRYWSITNSNCAGVFKVEYCGLFDLQYQLANTSSFLLLLFFGLGRYGPGEISTPSGEVSCCSWGFFCVHTRCWDTSK